ncbi:MAG: substrate-binding domain-containing protein [Spirochaetaceae bacterium]|jgi:LacI family transcriptional regulator|nr:substrate-binding domain-containing protein [Spirochaetaceae bacterium]
MRITQKDIARDLKISFATVNRAFNNTGYVSEELKKQIFDYAREKGYVPHRASQVLVRNKIRTIAVFSSVFPEFFWDDIERGVLSAAEQIKPFDYEVHFHRIPENDTVQYIRLLKQEIKNGLEAVAFVCQWWVYDMRAVIDTVEKMKVPYLLYNADAFDSNRICYIGTDYRAGGRLTANFIGKTLSLRSRGRVLAISNVVKNDRIAIGPEIHTERIRGFLDVMGEQYPGISCQIELIDFKKNVSRQIHGILGKYEHTVDAVYLINAASQEFFKALEQFDYRKTITVVHDINNLIQVYLENGLLTAAVYQDPVLQGYTTVQTLEYILESNIRDRQKDIEIIHTLIFKENTDFIRKHYILKDEK